MRLILETPRLRLRPFAAPDAEGFAAYRSDPLVAEYQGWDAPYSLERAAQFVSAMQAAAPGAPGEWYQLAIEARSGGNLLGDVAFKRLAYDVRQAEIGITLARAHHGQGFAREAAARLLDYLFGELGLHRVRANCDPANQASIRLLERLGFRHEGRWVESLWYKERWADEDWYAILEREWRAKPQ
ncbi:MAG: GNAT family N-acetyltransferase [Chloroflexota bacterium]